MITFKDDDGTPSGGGILGEDPPTRATAGVEDPMIGAGSGSKTKRPRDITSLPRFREVLFTKGAPQMFALVQRDHTIMYPPAIPSQEELEALYDVATTEDDGGVAEREAELRAQRDAALNAELLGEENVPAPQATLSAEERTKMMAAGEQRRQRAVASYTEARNRSLFHRKQLDALIKDSYEMNHTTFHKIPMRDTLRLLMRIGREGYANAAELETRMREARSDEEYLRQHKRKREEDTQQMIAEHREERYEDALANAELLQTQLDSQLFGGQAPAAAGGDQGIPDEYPDFADFAGYEEPDDDLMAMAMAEQQAAEAEMLQGGFPDNFPPLPEEVEGLVSPPEVPVAASAPVAMGSANSSDPGLLVGEAITTLPQQTATAGPNETARALFTETMEQSGTAPIAPTVDAAEPTEEQANTTGLESTKEAIPE